MALSTQEVAAAFEHGAPGVEVGFSIDTDGNLTIDKWGGEGDPPTPKQISTWAAEVAAAETSEQTVATTLHDRATQAIATLENAWANWATLTAAQKDAALKLNVRLGATLARLALSKLDAAP